MFIGLTRLYSSLAAHVIFSLFSDACKQGMILSCWLSLWDRLHWCLIPESTALRPKAINNGGLACSCCWSWLSAGHFSIPQSLRQASGFEDIYIYIYIGCGWRKRMATIGSPQSSPYKGPQISCKVLLLDDTIQLFPVPVSSSDCLDAF